MAKKKETAAEKRKRLKEGLRSFSTIGKPKKRVSTKKKLTLREIQAKLDKAKKKKK